LHAEYCMPAVWAEASSGLKFAGQILVINHCDFITIHIK
jgi:hypothetical protein